MSKIKDPVWKYIIVVTLIIIGLLNLGTIFQGVVSVWNASYTVMMAIGLAYIINILMSHIERALKSLKKGKRVISLLLALLLIVLFLVLLVQLILPSLQNAIEVFTRSVPEAVASMNTFLEDIFKNNPQIAGFFQNIEVPNIEPATIYSWFLGGSKGVSNVLGAVLGIVGNVINWVLILILAIYFLLDKERFFRLYHRLTKLYMKPKHKEILDSCLDTINQTFRSFIGGQFIEACILATLCSVGMLLLRMPYAVMIGIMVGFINIIPMVGAYIGGVVGFLMVLTVSPLQAVIFLVYLVVLQQIESNLIYPKVVGNSVGLPGIYVMISVIVLGSLAGIPGMLLGIPSVASLYKLLRRYITYKEQTA